MSDSFNINPHYQPSQKKLNELSYYIDGLVNRDRYILSEAITIIESQDPIKKKLARSIIEHLPRNKDGIRLAITGAPGVGKSTFIENFGEYLLAQDHSVAVLAIDPSSYQYKGSVLGDKTRMSALSLHSNAFIRPSSAGDLLGGVSRGTKDSIMLCEAAGYKYIFIETVGVGQSEYWGANICDFSLYLLQPGSGDDLQGIKRGILETSDLILINKSDGGQKELAMSTASAYKSVINLLPSKIDGFERRIINVSSVEHTGFDSLLSNLEKLYAYTVKTNIFDQNRCKQEAFWFQSLVKEEIFNVCIENQSFSKFLSSLNLDIEQQKIDSIFALNEINSYIQQMIKK